MLTKEEIDEIETESRQYPDRSSVCIEALRIVQRHRGWVCDEALGDIAAYLQLSREDLEGVATFYNRIFRRPVGRHVIYVCDSVSCWITGYRDVLEQLRERLGIELGATTADRRFTLLTIQCLGACERAPALMIDDDTYGNLDPRELDRILERYP